MPKFAANLSMLFNEVPFLDRFAAAARAGFRAVEFLFPYDYAPEEVAARLGEHGLAQALFNMPPGDWNAGERGMAAVPGRESEFRRSAETALAYARALGCTRVHAMAGLVPQGRSPESLEETYVANLRAAADLLAPHGIRLLAEPINRRDMPGYFLWNTTQAMRLIEAVGRPNVSLQLDLYHCQITEGDLARHVRDLAGRFAHVQIAGNPGRHEPSEGEINYPYVFGVLDEVGYDGWVGCEYRPKGTTVDGLAWARPYGIGR